MNFEGRIATIADVRQLAAMNHQLIRDEGHRNPMVVAELEVRMQNWLADEYQATVFALDGVMTGYALYKHEPDWLYLRQFFVLPEFRRRGLGRAALAWLIQHPWRNLRRIRLDVLIGNADAISFWRSVGFHDYCVTMEMDLPPDGRSHHTHHGS